MSELILYRCTAVDCCCGRWVIIRTMDGIRRPLHIHELMDIP
jgi:hypothetical protein